MTQSQGTGRAEGGKAGSGRGVKGRGQRGSWEPRAQHVASRWQHRPGNGMGRGCQTPSPHKPGMGTWAPRIPPKSVPKCLAWPPPRKFG